MSTSLKNIALIPMRGGSKSIPMKNIKPIAGYPLCYWSLKAACDSGIFDQIIVSTDSSEIADTVNAFQMPIEILNRPEEYAKDTSSTEEVMLHAAENYDYDIMTTIQVTSPLVNSNDFQKAQQLFLEDNYDSLVTGVRLKRFYWDDTNGTPLNYDPLHRPRRQDFNGVVMENGAFYMTRKSIIDQYKCRLGGKIAVYAMPSETAIEIDEVDDWQQVEKLLLNRTRTQNSKMLDNIKLLIVDVDGTLTDAGMYYTADGEVMKKFNTRDAKGLALLRQQNIDVAIMTSEDTPIVAARARKLNIESCFLGVKNKLELLSNLCSERNLELSQIAFIGDDINDLECIKAVGVSAAPNDAMSQVKKYASYVCMNNGGHGAVREFCEYLLKT